MTGQELAKLNLLFQAQAYQAVIKEIDGLNCPTTIEEQIERHRISAWVYLAMGDTERAYHLFWISAIHPEGRFGILVLTILAGQITVAIEHWQKFCRSLKEPISELPDARWYSPAVARAAIAQLESYPFPPHSPASGAAGLYRALLYKGLGSRSAAFIELSRVVNFYPLARVIRQYWLDQVACLPSPSQTKAEGRQAQLPPSKACRLEAAKALVSAANILIYPDVEVLEKKCRLALAAKEWQEALELVRRILVLDPNHAPSLEARWRIALELGSSEQARSDLLTLVEIYEHSSQIIACQQVADQMTKLFPDDERALLRVCFLQARLAKPIELAHHGRKLLHLCREKGWHDRFASYRRWLLRQQLSLDDRAHFEVQQLP